MGSSYMEVFDVYLVAINVIGFVFFAINTWLYSNTAEGQIDALLTITCILGGSLGILLSMLIFDRKAVKANMMSRVFIAAVFIIQVVLLLIIKGHIRTDITISFWKFFSEHKFLIIYILIINLVTFVAFAIDKMAAINHRSRIRIITLLGLAFIGGSISALVGMYTLRHKTKKDYFVVGIPLIIMMQMVALFYVMNIQF